jgi:hypothetical protein
MGGQKLGFDFFYFCQTPQNKRICVNQGLLLNFLQVGNRSI